MGVGGVHGSELTPYIPPGPPDPSCNNLHLIFFFPPTVRRSAAHPTHPIGEVRRGRHDLGDVSRLWLPHSEHHLAERYECLNLIRYKWPRQ